MSERLPFILAAGCSVIIKPSEYAGLSIDYIVKALKKTKLPKGIVSVLYGKGNQIGKRIVTSKGINMISFTGSSKTAKDIVRNSYKGEIKKLSLELGGKNPIIIDSEKNFHENKGLIVKIVMENGGQACIAGSLIFINTKIYKNIKKKLISIFEQLNKFQKPVLKKNRDRIYNKIKKKSIVYGFENMNSIFNKPIILEDINENEQIFKEEIFAPTIIIKKYSNLDNLINKLNNNSYGLATYLFSSDKNKISLFKNKIRYGRLYINSALDKWDIDAPIGGFRNSGFGQETSIIGLNNYRVFKSIIF